MKIDTRKRKNNRMKGWVWLVVIMTIGLLTVYGGHVIAADKISIEIDGKEVAADAAVDMRTRTLQLNLKSEGDIYDDSTKYKIEWSIFDGTSIAEIAPASLTNQTVAIVTAKSPGTATVTVAVKDAMDSSAATIASTTCKINVVFSIDTSVDNTKFMKIKDTDAERSLVMYADDPDYQLKLNFGEANDPQCQWESSDEEIMRVGQNTGIVKPVGAGRATITATYTQTGTTDSRSSTLQVYVIPKVTSSAVDAAAGNYEDSILVTLTDNSSLYTDAFFGATTISQIREKIVWVIKKDNEEGVPEVIATSMGMESDLIKLTPKEGSSTTSVLTINAKAGEYAIYFYPVGTYVDETQELPFTPSKVNLTVQADFPEERVGLNVKNQFDLSQALNLTLDDLNKYFTTPPVLRLASNASAANFASYSEITGVMDAKAKSTVIMELTVNSNYASTVKKLFGNRTDYKLTFDISDDFATSNDIVITKGERKELRTEATNDGTVEWESKDVEKVIVEKYGSDSAFITGVEQTDGESVLITASLHMRSGIIKKVFYNVSVDPTIKSVSLEPGGDIALDKGAFTYLTAKYTEIVSSTPFEWSTSNERIATITVASDKKSVRIDAKDVGDCVISIYNTRSNQLMASAKVIVNVPMSSLTLADQNITEPFYKQGRKLAWSFQPANCNRTDVEWSSSNPSVATVDSEGFVTYLKAGSTIISVVPSYNPNRISDSVNLTVEQSAERFTIEPNAMTLKVGDEGKQLRVFIEPAGVTGKVSYTSRDTSIATVDATGFVTAKGAGGTLIDVSVEGVPFPMSCPISVLQGAEEVTFDLDEYVVETNKTMDVKVTMKPVNSTDTLSFNMLDPTIATVKEGVITGVKAGSTYLQVKATSGADAIVPVHVRDSVKGLDLELEEASVGVGQKLVLKPVFTPEKPYNTALEWKSSKPSIATVEDGVVTGVKGGTTRITCVAADGGYKATCMVTVTEMATAVTLNKTSYNLALGKKVTLKATVTSDTATNHAVSWKSSNKKVATVTSKGRVKGIKVGTAKIRATAKDGSGAFATCKIRVVRKATKVKLNRSRAAILVGNIVKLKATIKPAKATIRSVKWGSSDNAVAIVDSKGCVQGIAPGLAKIRAVTKDGSNKTAYCYITVREKVESTAIAPKNTSVTVIKGSSVMAGFETTPANSTDGVGYTSDRPSVAKVDTKGKITGVRIGQAVIYATTSSGQQSYVDVNVVGINRQTITLRQYDTETLWVNGITQNVRWYSGNPMIATVVNGKIVARKVGTTRIYAVINGVKTSCKVRVTKLR